MSERAGGGRDVAHRVLAIGGSAGALTPLTRLAESLPAGIGAAALVTFHRAASGAQMLPNILNRHSVYRAAEPSDGDPLLADYIYVAPADRHLELRDGRLVVNRGPKVNGQRPAIDLLFESAARCYGAAVVAVVLSGNLDDGAAGLLTVRRAGGRAIVLDPEDAEYPSMPRSAIEHAGPVTVARADELPHAVADALRRLPADTPPAGSAASQEGERSVEQPLGAGDEPGMAVGVTCPECGGSLWISGDAENPVVRCRIGHRMTPTSLQELHSERLERALWAALRSLEEEVAVAKFMEEMSRRRDDLETADRHRRRREVASRETETLRAFLLRRSGD
jgi:two-component system chemotaxis response regulator CheB